MRSKQPEHKRGASRKSSEGGNREPSINTFVLARLLRGQNQCFQLTEKRDRSVRFGHAGDTHQGEMRRCRGKLYAKLQASSLHSGLHQGALVTPGSLANCAAHLSQSVPAPDPDAQHGFPTPGRRVVSHARECRRYDVGAASAYGVTSIEHRDRALDRRRYTRLDVGTSGRTGQPIRRLPTTSP